ncbi:MAG: hypothetical protein IT371_25480 [Deltaproteobacteria bacterium]|nr:hypothetical protein [Deltaproteobacteria bacterium]
MGCLIVGTTGAAACDADFGALELRWTLSGSASADRPDRSLDACEELGAVTARVRTLSGPVRPADELAPCRGHEPKHTLIDLPSGDYRVRVELLDGTGRALTRGKEVVASVTPLTGLGRVDFAPEDFVDPRTQQPLRLPGTYRFAVSYAGQSCPVAGQATPARQRVRVTHRDGRLAGALLCTTERCVPADGATPLPCQGTSASQTIANLPWGQYRIELFGQTVAGENCWERTTAVTVGVGDNPVVQHDLARLSRPACE